MTIKSRGKVKYEKPRLVRGMKDILPHDERYWEWIRHKVFDLAKDYGFELIATPILEEKGLFIRSIGESTDIVEKEMYSFTDQGGSSLVLRPESTASTVRAYNEHGMVNQPQPVKLLNYGSMFRRERPQAGRYREFHQFSFEVLGDDQPVIDAQLIIIAHNFFKELGIEPNLQINSLGNKESRETYKKELADYLKPRRNQLCDDCKKRLLKNPLRVLDCKDSSCIELTLDAPQIIDFLDEEDHAHFTQVLEYLDGMEVPYNLNPRIIRGLDYYSRTTFEIWPGENQGKAQSALGGGGRYDGLSRLIGGRDVPASGFSVGIERVISLLKENDIFVPGKKSPDIFLAQLGDVSRKKALMLFEQLRSKGIKVIESFSKDGIKPQLEIANRLNIKIVLILGQKEIIDGTILFRDMESGNQEVINFEKTIPELERRLSLAANNNGVKIRHTVKKPDEPVKKS
ncbi:histidine--tRNA ligase [Patescibacteria group bacterium]|nr:histidine--tRNA ligase [Patescibacteria group bacterium]MBU1890688.1 histidine--tRNA ligase [Patescibacteria group bacterium]